MRGITGYDVSVRASTVNTGYMSHRRRRHHANIIVTMRHRMPLHISPFENVTVGLNGILLRRHRRRFIIIETFKMALRRVAKVVGCYGTSAEPHGYHNGHYRAI